MLKFFRQAESRRRLGLADLDTEGAPAANSTNTKRKASRDLPAAATGTSKRSRLKTSSQSAADDDDGMEDDYSSPEDLTPDYDSDDDDVYRPPRTHSFTNALIRAGSRSTKDSSLDKSRHHQTDKTSSAAAAPPVIVKKQAGLLLQAAGKGLLNTTPTAALLAAKRGGSNSDADAAFSELLRPKAPTISFGLYGGHLSIDENSERGIAGLLRASSAGGGGRMGTSGGNAPAVVDEGPFVSLLSKVSSWRRFHCVGLRHSGI